MNILVTNDDGIDSKGLWTLTKAMSRVGQVSIIAPDKERSGVGSCLSFRTDINIKQVACPIPGVCAYEIDGTPSDCVMLGIGRLNHPAVLSPENTFHGGFFVSEKPRRRTAF